jgi:hypothetical protein
MWVTTDFRVFSNSDIKKSRNQGGVYPTGCDLNPHNLNTAKGLHVTSICLAEPGFSVEVLESLFN